MNTVQNNDPKATVITNTDARETKKEEKVTANGKTPEKIKSGSNGAKVAAAVGGAAVLGTGAVFAAEALGTEEDDTLEIVDDENAEELEILESDIEAPETMMAGVAPQQPSVVVHHEHQAAATAAHVAPVAPEAHVAPVAPAHPHVQPVTPNVAPTPEPDLNINNADAEADNIDTILADDHILDSDESAMLPDVPEPEPDMTTGMDDPGATDDMLI